MLDMFGLPQSAARNNLRILHSTGTTNSSRVGHPFVKPRDAATIGMILVSSGGGGGGGFTGAAGTARGGGGGGGAGSTNRLIFPAIMLPEVMYFHIPAGGLGGNPSSPGGAGDYTGVYAVPSTTQAYDTIALSGSAGGAGAAGAGSGAAAAGAAGAAAVVNSALGNDLWAIWMSRAGIIGGTGGNPATPTAGGASTNGNTSYGVGGGGGGAATTTNTLSAGGNSTGYGYLPTATGGAGGAAGGVAGLDGTGYLPGEGRDRLWGMMGTGGGGGGASGTSGVGGAGGGGFYGCGGGGGGGGVTGGQGGRGGSGLAIVWWW